MPLALNLLIIYLLIVLYFVMSSTTVEVADQKGYTGLKPSLISLIPIYGLVHYMRLPLKRNVPMESVLKSFKLKEILAKFVIYAELVLVAVIVLIPIIYIVGSSFAKTETLPTLFWPDELHLGNYEYLFTKTNFKYWYKNTIIIAVLNMIFGVTFITGAAYVFARFKFKGKKAGLLAILVLQVFPSFMGLIAMFTLFETFGLLGQPTALTILYVGGSVPFNIWLIKGYLQQIPKELDESAMIDGANKLQIFFKIILPLSVPILSFVAVTQFMAPWMDYMLPSYLLDVQISPDIPASQQWTLAVGLFRLITGQENNAYTTFAAGSLVVGLPITVLYMVFHRYLIEGITAGATKG
jgi:arabinogalactan oligomer/maltooligosaccharide transport system permease protein